MREDNLPDSDAAQPRVPWLADGRPTNDAADVLAMFPPALAQRHRGDWKPWYDARSRWCPR